MKIFGAIFLATCFFQTALVGQCLDIEQEVAPALAGDIWGFDADVSGDWAIVGSPFNATFNSIGHGAVDFYKRQANGDWEFAQRVFPDDIGNRIGFGWDVSIDGDNAVIGECSYNGSDPTGGVTIMEKLANDEWVVAARFENEENFTYFGLACAVCGNTVATGNVDGNPDGAIIIYEKSSEGDWKRTGEITATETQSSLLGYDVALNDNRVSALSFSNSVPGTNYEFMIGEKSVDGQWEVVYLYDPGIFIASASTAIEGDLAALLYYDLSEEPRIDLFDRLGTGTWEFSQRIVLPIPADAISIKGLWIEAGQIFVSNFKAEVEGISGAGEVLTYVKSGDVWKQGETIRATDPAINDWFGFSIAFDLKGGVAIIGAPEPFNPSGPSAFGGNQGTFYFYGSTNCTTLLLGDVNLDGDVNLLDVLPFVDLITIGEFQAEADANQDGDVNLLDVAPFVALLTGG